VLREAGFGVDTSFRSCGADDFSFYSPVAPILMLFVGSGGPFTLHHPKFLPPDESVGKVATVMLSGYLAALTLLLSAIAFVDRATPTRITNPTRSTRARAAKPHAHHKPHPQQRAPAPATSVRLCPVGTGRS
jgi:hypothetical protein